MKCPACGNENQPGAKFCVHCGIVLGTASAPAWTAAPAGSASAPAPRPAAPVQPTPTPAPSVARPAAATGPAPAPAAAAAAAAPESTRKAGLMIAVIALLIVLGAVGYFGYRMLSGEGKETVAAVEPPKPAEAPPSPPLAPATDKPATQDVASTAAPAASPPTAAAVLAHRLRAADPEPLLRRLLGPSRAMPERAHQGSRPVVVASAGRPRDGWRQASAVAPAAAFGSRAGVILIGSAQPRAAGSNADF